MIDVIIPYMNRPEYTEVLLENLYSIDHGIQIAPILVDNASRKRSKDLVADFIARYASLSEDTKKRIAEPRLVQLGINKGFSGAVNAGLANSSSEYVVIMHNDCIPFPGWAGEMHACFNEIEDDVGVVIPRTTYDYSHGSCLSECRKAFESIKPPNKDRLSSREVAAVVDAVIPDKVAFMDELRKSQFRSSYFPDFASYCFMTKSSMFKEYGLFDEEFWPRYWEDKFWWCKAEREGWAAFVANRAFVFHFGAVTADGPGFNGPDSFKANEERFRRKRIALDTRPVETQPAV